MANEFRHDSADRAAAGALTQAEFDSITAHKFASQATGDLLYASSASQLSRLAIGAAGRRLLVSGGIPVWTDEYEAMRLYLRKAALLSFVAWAAGTNVTSGSGSVNAKNEDEVDLRTGTTHASTAGVYRLSALPPATKTGFSINWDKKLGLYFLCRWAGTSATNLTLRLHLTKATTIVDLAGLGIGMQSNGANINLASYGAGGSQALVSGATSFNQGLHVLIGIEHDPASAIRLYINGVLAATQSTANNIPSGEDGDYNIFASIARSGGVDVASEGFRVRNVLILAEL